MRAGCNSSRRRGISEYGAGLAGCCGTGSVGLEDRGGTGRTGFEGRGGTGKAGGVCSQPLLLRDVPPGQLSTPVCLPVAFCPSCASKIQVKVPAASTARNASCPLSKVCPFVSLTWQETTSPC